MKKKKNRHAQTDFAGKLNAIHKHNMVHISPLWLVGEYAGRGLSVQTFRSKFPVNALMLRSKL